MTDWTFSPWFSDVQRAATAHTHKWQPLVDVLPALHDLWAEVVQRPSALRGERPQDFVAQILATITFRNALAAVHLEIAGYGHEATGLDRSMSDVELRLEQIRSQPVEASLGFYLSRAQLEAEALEKLLAQAPPGANTGTLPSNLQRAREHLDGVHAIVLARAHDPAQLLKKYGRINFAETARALGADAGRVHELRALRMGGVVHGRGMGLEEFVESSGDGTRAFSAGPIYDRWSALGVADTIEQALANLGVAAKVVGIERVDERVADVQSQIDNALHALGLPGGGT